ncbi:MAG: HAMP domain-containing sensor histidine kinase [bacterium]
MMRPVILFRVVLIGVALAYSAVISPYAHYAPSPRLLGFIIGYAVLSLLPLIWATLRSALHWFETDHGVILLRFTYLVDAVFLLTLAYAAGEGNDLWATFFIPWGMVLVMSSRTSIPVPILDTVLGVVLAAMIALTVWLTISSTPTSAVANALILWGVFMEGWVILRCLAEERREWAGKIRENSKELGSMQILTQSISSGLVLIQGDVVVAATGPSEALLQLRPSRKIQESALPENIVNRLQEVQLNQEGPIELECPATAEDGSKMYVGISAFPIDRNGRKSIALVLETRTTSVRREERLRRSNRLASVGQLAAGIAHELGNPIAIIKSCAAYLVKQFGEKGSANEEIEIIHREADRCQNLLSRLKSLASSKEEARRFDLRSAVQEAVSLARYQIKEIRLDLVLPREPVHIFADQSQIVALLVNLLFNAGQSMEGREKEPGIGVTLESKKGEATLRVSDHGRGMTPEEQDKIFDPFYTGRPNGTGLGLSIAHQVIEQLGGTIDVESDPGEGSTFTITIPLTDNDQSDTS